MGGHAAGEVASEIAVETLRQRIPGNLSNPAQRLGEAIEEANRKIIIDQRANPERVGMGTTLSAFWLTEEDSAIVGHIGDSRIYRFRDGELEQLTDDHSPIYRLYKEGTLEKEELRHHPQKNLIERSLGLSMTVVLDLFTVDVKSGDVYLLCTDGLTDCVSDSVIERTISRSSLDSLPENLVSLALDAGGYDNVTVVVVKVN